MQLAMEEKDLQKMATLSQHDEKLDELKTKLEAVTRVSGDNLCAVINRSWRTDRSWQTV